MKLRNRVLASLLSAATMSLCVSGAIVSAASTEASSTLELSLATNSATTYAEGDFEAGLEIPVAVVVDNYDEAEGYTMLQCNFGNLPDGVTIEDMKVACEWGDDLDAVYGEANYFTTQSGEGMNCAGMDFICSVISSDKSEKPGFSIASDGNNPFIKNGGKAVATFTVVLEEGMEAGDYTIDFTYAEGVSSTDPLNMVSYKEIATNGITFTLGDSEGSEGGEGGESEYKKGDVDMNGDVDVFDAVAVAQYTVGKVELSEKQLELANMDDGAEVDVFDAIAIAKTTV